MDSSMDGQGRGMAEVFEALERLAQGDPYVRVLEDEVGLLGSRLRQAVNKVAENMTELVDDSHELAMGLAEHFDVLQRVSDGDLSARIEGVSGVEILEFLRGLTNGTIASLSSEIVARRTAEEGLARLAVAVEQSTEGIAITDPAGVVQYVNPSLERIAGLSGSEVLGKELLLLMEGADQPSLRESLWRAIKKGVVWCCQFENGRNDGTKYEVAWTVSPVFDAGEKVTNFAAVMRDITSERDMERRLSQTQRLEAIGTLAGGIAHEFNNLLTVIVGFSEMAFDKSEEDSSIRPDLERVIGAADRARNLVRQILAFSREEDDSEGPAPIVPVVEETLKLLRASLPTTIEIEARLDDSSVVVSADSAQVQQILMNLGTNAAHAMREHGGELLVSLEEIDVEAGDSSPVPDLRAGHYVLLSVRDTGCGMTPAILGRVFEPFFTTKPVGEGTGLGLAVVHGLARGCGGGVAIESEPGKGTTIKVLFPAVTTAFLQGEELDAKPPPGGKERILVVDDEQPIVELLENQLARLGYTVTPCLRSPDALALFHADPTAFDLVISDQTMPEITGMELAQELLETRAGLPILLCTGYSESVTPERVAEIGIKELLLKPLRHRQLAEAIRRALG